MPANDLLQRIFNKVYIHLLTQMRKSLRAHTGGEYGPKICAYRSDEGLSCAIGCLIDDRHYTTDLENECASHGRVTQALVASGWGTFEEVGALGQDLLDLQDIHDRNLIERWPTLLERFARSSSLTIPSFNPPTLPLKEP